MIFRNPSKLFLSLSLFFFMVAPAMSQGISVQLDGRNLQFDQPPAMIGGRLLVPLRGIFEALQADVVYDAPTRSIQATKGSRVVQLQLGSRTAIIDGRTLFLDVPADTIGGRTMVPLRFVSEALGADVKWEGATKTVRLSSSGEDGGSTPPPNNNEEQADAPRIDQVIHNATRALQPGQTVDVVVYGEPGGQATFEILGATQAIALSEVSSGKYQTRWTIPNGLVVSNGVLVGHLTKNGKKTVAEAQRPLTVSAVQAPAEVWNISPQDGATVTSARPSIALIFPQNVQPNSVRFYLDGLDFSNQVRLNGRQLIWQPDYDLNNAQHQAEVQAVSTSGQRLTHRWNFNVNPNTSSEIRDFSVSPDQLSTGQNMTVRLVAPSGGQGTFTVGNLRMSLREISPGIYQGTYTANSSDQGIRAVQAFVRYNSGQTLSSQVLNVNFSSQSQLSVTNLSEGMSVGPNFNVQGRGTPGRTVSVTVEYSSGNILEALTGQMRTIRNQTVVGSNGYFDVPIDGSVMRQRQRFRVTVSDGQSQPIQMILTRQ